VAEAETRPTDYRVVETAGDARAHGFDVIALDAIRAVNVQQEGEARALNQMEARGATFFTPTGHSAAPPKHHW
jgi:nicotinamidase-related amidase